MDNQQNGYCPDYCPITFEPFFTWMEHPNLGWVPTYGGPFDSYTIPEPDLPTEGTTPRHEVEFTRHRYDHDEGCWHDCGEDPCLRVITEEALLAYIDQEATTNE